MPLRKNSVKGFVRQALEEDAVFNDITTLSFIPKDARVEARIIAKEAGVACGVSVAREVFKTFDKNIFFKAQKNDGGSVARGEALVFLKGKARSILSCERVALNFLSYLSGIASDTRRAVLKVRSMGIQILDTRKTTPLYRAFEKYAVIMGGGMNHRFSLSGQYLVKDNHIFILKDTCGLDVLAKRKGDVSFEIEVEDLSELKKALDYGPNSIMLDNFLPKEVRQAVRLLARLFPKKANRPFIELSGGIALENISRYAIKGVDFISLGSLTHSSRALDLSLEITKVYSR
ncbi:MAG: nicotinate-nucleotide diphosphorylase (carboxylating) [Candidatus Omnitrophica bacterium CG1_02_44_16]|nr:MAG: nicotinate-nucleotide diphosphorylase (carboxylating) [Candidatus Omnitrophica bacterium CG1_02_44_16]PIY82170.1 MAG: nicotinate-nucleotide diphosphorylase (carboxylating) [Candidatus Omnitrophica bacterium CG_4_10_14_0_8_um_filter_44_12]PIZ83467.1 MAG: nicotinate-nucleotide diphosphorylase (carboxylating) [Candidatus Omnitrophica bacterium CG_4_10_14_0_2_um_filter_44_9]